MDDLEARLAELLVATSDYHDNDLPESLQDFLRVLREHLNMDIVFVSKIADGRRTFMAVDSKPEADVIKVGMSDPVEQSWCHNIVLGRLPELIRDGKVLIASGEVPYTPLAIGTHLSVPILMPDGKTYGTLCTFAFHVDNAVSSKDIRRLRNAAQLIGARLASLG